MRTVTLEVASREKTDRRVLAAFEGQPQGDFLSFETPALLFKVLTPTRWELLSALTGAGPVTSGEAAERSGRDANAVGEDLSALAVAGILDRAHGGRFVFPYDAVHVDFFLKAA
ncbi:MAG: transcriptional regulator [Acidobacteriota bacterium]